MSFKEKIEFLENSREEIYSYKIGSIPVILTAVHTVEHQRKDGTVKFGEPYTKAISEYVATETKSSIIIKNIDNGIDSNQLEIDEFKKKLLKTIKDNNIKLLLDLHGASVKRDFDVELGTLNNLSADYSTIKELEDAFKESGVYNISFNNPFKGGGITQYIYDQTNIDIIQIEINGNYRNIEEPQKIKMICDSLIKFINQYIEIISK